MRYAGQGHEIKIDLPDRPLTAADPPNLRDRFESAYRTLFSRHIPGAAIEIMSWVCNVSTVARAIPRLPDVTTRGKAPAPSGSRTVLDSGSNSFVEAMTYARSALGVGDVIPGPALIIEEGTTTYVSPTFDASIDAGRAIVLRLKPKG